MFRDTFTALNFFEKKNYYLLILFFFVILISSIFELVGLSLLLVFFKETIDLPDIKIFSIIENHIFKLLNFVPIEEPIYLILGLVIFTFFIKSVVSFFLVYLKEFINLLLGNNIAFKINEHYIKKTPFFISYKNNFSLIRDILSESRKVSNYFISILNILSDIILILAILFFISYANVDFLYIIASLLFISLVFFHLLTSKTIQSSSKKLLNYRQLIANNINDNFNLFKEHQSINNKNTLIKFFERDLKNYFKFQIKIQFISKIPRYYLEIYILIVLTVIVIYFFVFNYGINQIFGSLSILVISLLRILPYFSSIINSYSMTKECHISVSHINKILKDKKEKIIDYQKLNLVKNINLKNVTFAYGKKKIINNLNLDINNKDIIGIYGNSGIGKSTLAKIFLNYLNPTKGQIIINGNKTNNKTIYNFAFLTNDPVFFKGSVTQNITMFKSLNYKRMLKCLKISSLPKKFLNRQISNQSAVEFSTGQKQRISIARALYHQPKFIVLDEITSNLNKELSKKIYRNFKKELKIPMIIISHNLQNLSICNKIYKISNKKAYKIKSIN
tara:strand:+ start:1781 stop:3466 length:1686 start_codon:yes stop_codon:yes gene_type:complete